MSADITLAALIEAWPKLAEQAGTHCPDVHVRRLTGG